MTSEFLPFRCGKEHLHSDRSAFCTSSGAAVELHQSDRSAFCTSSGAAEESLHAVCAHYGAARDIPPLGP